MTTGRTLMLALGFVAAVALGVAIGPSITDRQSAEVMTPAADVSQPASAPVAKPAAPARAKSATPKPAPVPADAPAVQARLKSVLNKGTDVTMASDGFRDAEQFATVAYAAHNTKVPFILLKHRVLNEKKSVEAAIRESKPDVNAAVEAARARAEARSEIAAIGS